MSKKEISSGTEKAENLTRKNTAKKTAAKPAETKGKAVKNTQTKSKKSKAKKPAKKVNEKRLAKRREREQKKIELAKIRAEKKQKRLEKKLESKQKRLDRIAAMKQAKAERREKSKERRAMLRHETKEHRIQRRKEERQAKIEARVARREAELAERRARREHRLKVRAEKRAAKNDKRHAPGFGGWLAAVISLGVTTLALGTMLTFGWMNMNGMEAQMSASHTESLYELNAIVDNLDTDLSKMRVSNSKQEQVKLLTEIIIESETAETVLERLPMDIQLTQNMTSFVNKMGDAAQSMLFALANGKTLTESQIASLEYMYKTNMELKNIINELTATSGDNDMIEAMRGKSDSLMYVSFGEIQNTTIETPKEINDGPFAENIKKVSAKNLEGLDEISAPRAEELAKQYFQKYGVNEVCCTGETVAEQLSLYNVVMKTNDGEMSAQLSKQGGKVIEFNSYKDCSAKNFSVERCVDIAEDFLATLGFKNMKAVWTSENGSTCNLNFAATQDGIVLYSDMVKVKVCEERGIVTGMEALSYALNHTERKLPQTDITKNEAKAKLNAELSVETSRLCLMPIDGGEVLAYEFYGSFDGSDYYVYIDARTGEEIEVFKVIGTAQGRALL